MTKDRNLSDVTKNQGPLRRVATSTLRECETPLIYSFTGATTQKPSPKCYSMSGLKLTTSLPLRRLLVFYDIIL